MAERYISADPYPWPYNGDLRPENTALIVIDMQTDFCGKGGYIDLMGYDIIADPRSASSRSSACSTAMRGKRLSHHPHPRGTSARSGRSARQQALALAHSIGAGIGDPGPCGRVLVRGEPGWEIIPELAPLPGETDHRQAGQGLVLRHRSGPDPAPAGHRATSC